MGQQVGSEPDLLLEVNDFTLIFPSFLEMIWLTAWEKQIPLFVNTKSISCLAELSLTVFLLSVQGLQSATGDRTSTRRTADGKSASLSAVSAVTALEAGSAPILPTNLPPLSFSVTTSSQSGVFSPRLCQRNKPMQVIGKQVLWSLPCAARSVCSEVCFVWYARREEV